MVKAVDKRGERGGGGESRCLQKLAGTDAGDCVLKDGWRRKRPALVRLKSETRTHTRAHLSERRPPPQTSTTQCQRCPPFPNSKPDTMLRQVLRAYTLFSPIRGLMNHFLR
eukprot:Gregarina_sp_Pseudo_9__5446@NODE_683_length_2372_cov_7_164595_g646_i0_p4_GENE_NODE_683_length_2372_cov_7_164595_g646_i0NODE_683_length_2372_cov_7_164595_g646_i0_p4_ORF_typecomplete_len111_score6_17_NODE_683_length_2372_cov_7_164595_g646_i08511183